MRAPLSLRPRGPVASVLPPEPDSAGLVIRSAAAPLGRSEKVFAGSVTPVSFVGPGGPHFPAAAFSAFALSVRSHVNSGSSRPK